MTGLKSIFAFLLIGLLSPVILGASTSRFESELGMPRSVRAAQDSLTIYSIPSSLQSTLYKIYIRSFGMTIDAAFEMMKESERTNRLSGDAIGGDTTNVKPANGTFPSKPSKILLPKASGGVAQIFSGVGKKVSCSGVVLKPWIVLTTADCVKDISPKNMVVKLIIKEGNDYKSVNVQAYNITRHPNYAPGDLNYDFAVLYLFAEPHWNVEPFFLPSNFKAGDFKLRKIATFVNEWTNKETTSVFPKDVTTDFKVCEEKMSTDYFCANVGQSRNLYKKADIGSPLFYKRDTLKRLLGLYTGFQKDKKVKGHVYKPIHPIVDWLEEFIVFHPLPPIFINFN